MLPWTQNFSISINRGPANMTVKTKKMTCMTFLCMIALGNKTIAQTFLPSLGSTMQMAVSIKKEC